MLAFANAQKSRIWEPKNPMNRQAIRSEFDTKPALPDGTEDRIEKAMKTEAIAEFRASVPAGKLFDACLDPAKVRL